MLVGRERELNELNGAFRRMLQGNGSVLFITGEAGLGKTTLVHEWWKTVPAGAAIYAEAACSIPIGNTDVGRLEALQPWADIITHLQTLSANVKKKLDVKQLIHDAAPAWAWAIPLIGDIAHAAVETHQIAKRQRGELDGNPNAQNQQQVFQQYVNLLAKISEHSPVVILLDDMHWADDTSTNLLFYLSRQLPEKKLFVVATYRPEDAAAANDGKGHAVIQIKNEILRYETGKELPLEYLDGSAIRKLLAGTFPGYAADDEFERWLRKISDGNALFVTQFIKTLREDGHLNGNGKFTGDYETIPIPESALAVVAERTRRLDDETKELLRYATAEGEEFTSYVLGALTEKQPLALLRELRKAETAGLIRSKKGARQFANQTTSVFGFSHALFHKALYDGLLPQEREILHRQCYAILKAEWDRLAKTKERTVSFATKLLMHAEKCGELKTAAEVALESAKGAWQTFAESEALEMLARAQRLAEHPDTAAPKRERATIPIEALILRAKIQEIRGRYDEAIRSSDEALALAEKANDISRIVRAHNQHARISYLQSEYASAETHARQALALAERRGNKKEEARALSLLGVVQYYRGAYDEALDYHTRSLRIQQSIRDRQGIATSLGNIGNVHYARGAYENALDCYNRSLRIYESLGDRQGVATSLNNIGAMHSSRRTHEEALEYFHRSLCTRESIGDRQGIATSLMNIGAAHSDRGEYDEALHYHTRSLHIFETIGDRQGAATSLNNIGTMYSSRGAYDQALEHLTRSLQIKESIGDRAGVAETLLSIGATCRKLGNAAEARLTLERARSIAVKIESNNTIAYILCELGLAIEAEAKQSNGGKNAAALDVAIAILSEGVAKLKQIRHQQKAEYGEELERMKRERG